MGIWRRLEFSRMAGTTPEIPEGVSIFVANINGEKHNCVSFLSPEEAFKVGLAEEAIIGTVDSTLALTPAHFKRNAAFRKVLHEVIARVGPTLAELTAEARRQCQGCIYIIDERVKDPDGKIEPEDILGAFRVIDGAIRADTYQMNENHRIVSENGLFRLPAKIQTELLKKLSTYRPKPR